MKTAGSWESLKKEIRWNTEKNWQPQDYNKYLLAPGEWFLSMGKGAMFYALVAYVFYRSPVAFFILMPTLLLFVVMERRRIAEKRKRDLMLQFRELMHEIIAGLQAGYSIENAFIQAYDDMRLLYGKNAMISRELQHIGRELKNNVNLEDVLDDWALRAHVQDITDFAEVFRIAKRSGGDLPGILRNAADLISERIEVEREITTLIASKKMEQNIMDLVPFGIILYIDATSPGFFDPLYHNAFGIALMTVLFAVYLAAYFLSRKILDIAF